MSIYKRGPHYWYKFMHAGELIRESTGQGNDRKARQLLLIWLTQHTPTDCD